MQIYLGHQNKPKICISIKFAYLAKQMKISMSIKLISSYILICTQQIFHHSW